MKISLLPHSLDKNYEFLSICTCQDNPQLMIVSLDRPNKLNAINAQMWSELGHLFSQLGRLGDDCRCVLLRGNRSFCSGIDFRDPAFSILGGGTDGDGDDDDDDSSEIDPARRGLAFAPQLRQMQECFTAIEDCPVPVVAAMHGVCIGAGIDMVCCADVRLCTENATFSIREVQLGLAADVGTLQRLPKIVGHSSRVRELCLTGEDFHGVEAHRIGFVSKIYPSEDALWHGAIHQVCSAITRNSPLAVAGTKQSLLYARDHSVKDGLEQVMLQNIMALQTNDVVTTLVAKRSKTTPMYPKLPRFSKL